MNTYETRASDVFNQELSDVLPGAVHYNFRASSGPPPVRLTSARGSRARDIDGNEYLDLSSAFGALILGHHHEEFSDTIKSQIEVLLQVTNSDLELEAAAAVRRWFPAAEMVRFGVSGTELVSCAVRLARAWTGKQKLLRFGGHYHGSSDLLLGGTPQAAPGPPVLLSSDPFDTEGRVAGILARECIMVPWNDLERTIAALDDFASQLACVILEPVCLNGGGLAADAVFLRALRDTCTRHRILLVFDEMITGVRLGKGGAQALYGVLPDLFIAGKALSNGIPAAVLAGRSDVMRLLAERRVTHAGTYNGYPLGLRAIITTLDILSRDDYLLVSQLAIAARRIAEIFQRQVAQYDVPLHVRVHGSAAIFHVGPERDSPLEYGRTEALLGDILLARTLQALGVLVCPISRCYTHAALAAMDFAFLEERLRGSLELAAPKLKRLAGARVASDRARTVANP